MAAISVYELAKRYYPRLWSKPRIEALAEAGKLTEVEKKEIIDQAGHTWEESK